MTVVAGVDSSTQSCTVALYDADTGVLLGSGSAPHSTTNPPVSEQSTDTWWAALAQSLDQACRRSRIATQDIRAISVAAQYHGLVALDAQDRLVRPVKLWNDTTSGPQAARLVAGKPTGWWAREVGSTPTAAFTITKLAWLAEHEPDRFATIRSVMVPHDWLTYRLSGRKVTDRVDASGTGYFNAVDDQWRLDILAGIDASVDWASRLPRVLGPEEPAGLAETGAARELGLRPDTVVACGTGDQAAAALALGVGGRKAAISLGTSGTVITGSTTPVFDPGGEINVTANAEGGFQPIAVLLNAAKVTDTFARLLGVDHSGLANLALEADPLATDGPLLVAYLDGERTPNRPDSRGLLAGLSTSMTREGVARAAFEGVAFGLRAGLDAIRGLGVDVDGSVLLTGGASVSEAYRRILAAVLETEVAIVDGDSSLDAARGAAIQAVVALGEGRIADVKSAWHRDAQIVATPEAGGSERTRDLYERYLSAREIRALDGLFP